jgi:alginate O-acetyltransferase complex protein AlgI
MTLAHIAIFAAAALVYGLLLPARWRGWYILIVSVIAVFWLQPLLPIRQLDFWLPTLTVMLTVAAWYLTRPAGTPMRRDDWAALLVIAGTLLLLSLMRDVRAEFRPTASRPPEVWIVAGVMALVCGLGLALFRVLRLGRWRGLLTAMILIIVVLFVMLKAEPLAVAASAWLRARSGQDVSLASALDLGWLGFSYVAFRLIHTLRDRQTGRLPALSLREYATYVIFFPSLTAGPIDRAERFAPDYRAVEVEPGLTASRVVIGGGRIFIGLFKKFVLADSLALFALNAANAAQTSSIGGFWLLLYAYAFRLFFDFSGYSDIAIGLGILYGIQLPENFDRPYLRPSLAAFWQSWHITLSNWARFYVFSPVSRALLQRKPKPSPLLVVFSAQMLTMLTIALWHGISWNFVLWGLWHGIGLFVHKLWSDRTRTQFISAQSQPFQRWLWRAAGVLLTFHFVALGWVWFAVPDMTQAARLLLRLFGMGG